MSPSNRLDRRSLLKATGVGIAIGMAGCSGDGSGGGGSGSIKTIETEGGISVATFLYAQSKDIWDEYNVNLSFEAAPYARYNRQVVSGSSQIGGPASTATMGFINDGEDLVFVGNQLNMFNRMFTKSGREDIEDPSDLGGMRLGLPAAETSTTSYTHRALVADEYDFNLLEDTAETVAAGPPALWELLQNDELDAISEFSGFTIRGMASDEMKTIFDPHELWTSRFGTGLPTTLYSAQREWFESNQGLTARFLDGWNDAVDLLASEANTALQNFGQLSGVTTDAQAEVVRNLAEDDTLYGPAYMTEDGIESTWEFFNLLEQEGAFDQLPDKDSVFLTESDIRPE